MVSNTKHAVELLFKITVVSHFSGMMKVTISLLSNSIRGDELSFLLNKKFELVSYS